MTPFQDMDKLQKIVHTTSDRQALLQELERAQAHLFSQGEKPLSEAFPRLHDLLSGATDFGAALTALRSRILDAPVVRLTLAFEPTPEQVEKMVSAVRSGKDGQFCLIEIELDPKIMAGVVISDGGVVTDKSLKKKIEALELQPILAKYVPFFA